MPDTFTRAARGTVTWIPGKDKHPSSDRIFPFFLNEERVDHDEGTALAFGGHVQDHQTLGHPHLGGGQADAGLRVHRPEHGRDQAEKFLIDLFHGLGGPLQDGVAEFSDFQEGRGFGGGGHGNIIPLFSVVDNI
jgi:hypothetical protein